MLHRCKETVSNSRADWKGPHCCLVFFLLLLFSSMLHPKAGGVYRTPLPWLFCSSSSLRSSQRASVQSRSAPHPCSSRCVFPGALLAARVYGQGQKSFTSGVLSAWLNFSLSSCCCVVCGYVSSSRPVGQWPGPTPSVKHVPTATVRLHLMGAAAGRQWQKQVLLLSCALPEIKFGFARGCIFFLFHLCLQKR